MRDSGRRLCIVIVAEGAQDDSGNPVTSNHIREVRRLVKTKFPCELSAIIKLQSYLHYRLPLHNDHLSTTGTCVASVSVRFRNKERGTRAKDRAKNCASKREGRGWGRMEGNACLLASFPSPSPLFHFLVLVSFLARPKPKIPFLCLSLLWNQTETFFMFTLFFPTLFATSFPGFSPTLPTEREILKKKTHFHKKGFALCLVFYIIVVQGRSRITGKQKIKGFLLRITWFYYDIIIRVFSLQRLLLSLSKQGFNMTHAWPFWDMFREAELHLHLIESWWVSAYSLILPYTAPD